MQSITNTTDLDFNKINELIKQKYIYSRTHPSCELLIFNYTEKTVYDNYWTPETLACRGLVTDNSYKVVARPFRKFFNIESNFASIEDFISYSAKQEDMALRVKKVYEKLDGSLGILYFYDNKPYIATRGEFSSIQAKEATNMLYNLYPDTIKKLNPEYTYLFEIIYPENRVIVDYKEERSLTLLGVIDTKTGHEFDVNLFSRLGFPIIKEYVSFNDLKEDNREGYVVILENGIRFKLKFRGYVSIAKFLSQLTPKRVWQQMRDNICVESFLSKIPDEFYNELKALQKHFNEKYQAIEEKAKTNLGKIISEAGKEVDRKTLASLICQCPNKDVIFKMLDKQDYSKLIWKHIEPNDFEILT